MREINSFIVRSEVWEQVYVFDWKCLEKNTTYLTWTVFIYVIKNKHSIILYERNEFCIVEIKYGNNFIYLIESTC